MAIKFVTGVTQYPEATQRFAREARTLASLRHGGIVTVHDAGTVDHDEQPLPYLVMELLDGTTWEFAQVDAVLETGARVAEVLAHVHAARIVHRDVKPANIMICADGRAVLMDFGIARDDASRTRTVTATGHFFGTPAYMAPEQLQGRAATPASDVYALGIVLVEKLTGHRLPVAQLMPQVRASLHEPLRSLLDRMTSAHPEQRPTAEECASALRTPARSARSARSAWSTRPLTVRGTPTPEGPEWPRRLVPAAVLLVLYAIVLFRPGYGEGRWSEVIAAFGRQILEVTSEDFSEWNDRAWGAVTTVGACLGVVTLLVTAVLLVPASRLSTRLAGYASAALLVLCLGWQAASNPPYYTNVELPVRYGMWLFYLVTALAFAVYAHREVRTRRSLARP